MKNAEKERLSECIDNSYPAVIEFKGTEFDGKGKTMEIYTTLEQALHDSSLAIITNDIKTQIELNSVYAGYLILLNKYKRLSNYYSNKFLGHNVTEMYVLVKDRLKSEDKYIFGELELPSEKYAVSEPDLYYNAERFNSGKTNICFILGHSGSGKSKMARALEGDDIDHIELDDLLLIRDHFTMDELKSYSDMLYSYFAGEGAKYYIGIKERESLPKEEYEDKVFIDFVRYAMDYAKQNAEKKFIIEGIWIYLYFDDPSVFKDYAVFIKGTSFLKSKIRAMKREMRRDDEDVENRKLMFGREVRNYLLDEDKIDSYRKYYGASPDAVYIDETNEAAKKQDAYVNLLNEIDECFVNGDADGIREIRGRVEESTGLSSWNKLRIITECESALLDLALE